eukprot:CAMPEP_0114579166 /NCGR_PEP_ID=MMETSP0125-20121206/3592_1 /TAXON_ID=485358 ORGANISM="Aristerostoma sp., Strain ATCC 50986" /NCGR_SAMPLE_ID=MMETSP0125 /ASSEMBLY_ACC=CAM_ASM_000245 /LENGTH=71 /DNA_ID=CAMNT_0001769737 /DNA_START=2013 /DNA_END=2228 /DNA_ORIENTATION=+
MTSKPASIDFKKVKQEGSDNLKIDIKFASTEQEFDNSFKEVDEAEEVTPAHKDNVKGYTNKNEDKAEPETE